MQPSEGASAGPVESYSLESDRLRARILSYGGILQSLEAPDRHGHWRNVTLGFNTVDEYRAGASAYFGAIIGRFANRLRGGTFSLDGATYRVPLSDGANSLHGGQHGFDTFVWDVEAASSTALTLTRVSHDGEEGYPGSLRVAVTYSIDDAGGLRMDYVATTDAPTIVNLTNHAYFNLRGDCAGDVYDHSVWLNASAYTPVDDGLIPTGEIASVDGTRFDFRQPRSIGQEGYDHNWVLDDWRPGAAPVLQARVVEPTSGRLLEVLTTEPGIQFYTGNLLDGSLTGSGGCRYQRGAGFTLETQHFPDSPNHPNFPSTLLRPGEEFRSTTIYRLVAGA
jgi:aldose 1-epimerase